MAELATLARPYANAAYEIAKENDRVTEWARALSLLSQLVSTSEMTDLIKSPEVTPEGKAHLLNDLISDEDPPEQTRRFVGVLAENRRLDLIADIHTLFEEKRAEDGQILDVVISTAVEPNDSERSVLESALKKHFDSDVTINFEIEPNLIGGAFIRAGDRVIDGSIRGKLAKMQEALGRA